MSEEIQGKNIAILGATSHIAKGLIYNFNIKAECALFLFARALDILKKFIDKLECRNNRHIKSFEDFHKDTYDVIINCVGIGDPAKLKAAGSSVFALTETFDNLVLDYLEKHPYALYINFSSGVVYGTDFSVPVGKSSYSKWDINNLSQAEYYGISKLNSEAKHRALKNLNIVDLRIFSYFSRFINLQSKFLLTEIISCIKEGKEFVTGQDNIIRDYIHPNDLYLLIEKCIERKTINDALDAYSLKPARKFEILDYFATAYGLKYEVENTVKIFSITGSKNNYYSNNKRAEVIGYIPKFNSLDCIIQESHKILGAYKS